MTNLAMLVLRLVVGLTLAAHGAQKVFGAFDGPGIRGFSGMVDRLGLWPVPFWAWAAALAELVGGLLLALGLLTPLAAAAGTGAMLMAIVAVHWPKGFFAAKGGLEFPLSLLGGIVAVALGGPGAYSLDRALRIALPEPQAAIAGVLLGAVGVVVALATRSLRRSRSRQVAG